VYLAHDALGFGYSHMVVLSPAAGDRWNRANDLLTVARAKAEIHTGYLLRRG
jgi:hypothetical protein